MFTELIRPLLNRDTLPSNVLYSFGLHVGTLLVVYAILNFSLPEPPHEEVSIQLYAGESDGTGNKGSTRPKLKKAVSDFSDSKGQTKQTGAEDGAEDGFEDGRGVDWGNGSDPTLDAGSRYTARIIVDVSQNDYPASARRSNLGNVIVAVTLYVSSKGNIRDVRVRYVRASSGDVKPFERDFILATRNIFLKKARLANMPYSKEGKAHDFIWDTTVTYSLQ